MDDFTNIFVRKNFFLVPFEVVQDEKYVHGSVNYIV